MEHIIPLRYREMVFTKLSDDPIDYFITKAEVCNWRLVLRDVVCVGSASVVPSPAVPS